jgi:hypothetical protein
MQAVQPQAPSPSPSLSWVVSFRGFVKSVRWGRPDRPKHLNSTDIPQRRLSRSSPSPHHHVSSHTQQPQPNLIKSTSTHQPAERDSPPRSFKQKAVKNLERAKSSGASWGKAAMARTRRDSYLARSPQTDNGHGAFRTAGPEHVPSAPLSLSPSPSPPSDSSALPAPRGSTSSTLQTPGPTFHVPHRFRDPYPYSTAQTAIGHEFPALDVESQSHSSHGGQGHKVGPPLADRPPRKSMSEMGHGPVTFAPFTPTGSDSDLGHYDEYIKFYHGELASKTEHALRLRYSRQLDNHDLPHDVRADFPPRTRFLEVDTNPSTPARSNSVMSMLPSMPQSRCQEHRASEHGFMSGLKRALSGQAYPPGMSSPSLSWRSPSPHGLTSGPISAGRAMKSERTTRSDPYLDAMVMRNPGQTAEGGVRTPRKLKRRSIALNRTSLPPTQSDFFFVEDLNGSASMEKHASVEWQPYDSRTSMATAPSPELVKRPNRKLTKKRQSMGGAGAGMRASSRPSLLPAVEVDVPVGDSIDYGFVEQPPLIPMPASLDVREIMADRALSSPVQELMSPYANPQEYPWALPIGVPLNAIDYSHALHTAKNVKQGQTQTPPFNTSPEQGVTVEDLPLVQHGRTGSHGRSYSQPHSLKAFEPGPSDPPTANPLNSISPADSHRRDPSNHSDVGSLIDQPALERRVSRRRWTLNIAGEEMDDDVLRQELERLRLLGEEPDQQRAHTPNGAAVKEAAWKMQKRALLSSREVILTERSYLSQLTRFHSAVIGGYAAGYCPDILFEYLPLLIQTSQLFSSFMEEDPSAWGVSAAFISAADVLERTLVAYCAVAGEIMLKCRKAGSSNQGPGIGPWSNGSSSGHQASSNLPITDELGGQQQSSVMRSHSAGLIGRRKWRKSLPSGTAAPAFGFGFGMSTSSSSVPPSSYTPLGVPPSRSSSNTQVYHSDPSSPVPASSSSATTTSTPVTSHSNSTASIFTQGKLRANMTASEVAVQPTQRVTRYVLLYRGRHSLMHARSP